jgi:hypothetical protein
MTKYPTSSVIVTSVAIAAIVLFGTGTHSQTPAKPAAPVTAPVAKPKTPPAIPVETREKFFKAQAEVESAQTAFQQAQKTMQDKTAAFQAQLAKAQEACGADYTITLDMDGELVCVEKPSQPAPAETKK